MRQSSAKLIEKRIREIKQSEKIAFIPYITCWDPDLETTEKILWELSKENPACIELGFPFSDPVADGPTIQKAIIRALKHKPSLSDFFSFVSYLKKKNFPVPILCMTYYNIIYRYNPEKAVEDALTHGVDGFIIPDLPIEEAKPWLTITRNSGLATVFLATPASPDERIKKIAKVSKGFLYYVSVTGITGERKNLPSELVDRLKRVKQLVKIPIGVGFGISSPSHVKLLAPYTDAVIIGSALVKLVENYGKEAPIKIKEFIQTLKQI